MQTRWDTITVDGSPMRCYVAMPDGAGPYPAVVVIQHAGGVDAFIQTMTGRIGEAGFAGIAPDLYHRDAADEPPLVRMGRLRDPHIVADVSAAIDHLHALPEVGQRPAGITGFCMGGRVAYLMATHRPDLQAAVVFYGGNILVPWGEGPAPFERTGDIGCPVLGLFGQDDGNPSPADVAKIDAEMTRLGKPHEFHSYPGAGHGFMSEASPAYRERAAEDAWPRCIGWFERYLERA